VTAKTAQLPDGKGANKVAVPADDALNALAVAHQLALLQQPPHPAGKGLGARRRRQSLSLRHMAFKGIVLKLTNEKRTDFDEHGGFDTDDRSNHLVLPNGVRIGSTDEVAYWCCKFRRKSQLKYCGPQSKESAILCTRCNASLCRRHSWQFLFSQKRFCSWCLFVRAVEILLSLAAFIFKLFALLLRWLWHSWFRAYR